MSDYTEQKNLVFYADDDLDDIELIKDAFSRYSNQVYLETAMDGMEAMSMLHNYAENGIKPCLIILDINMPKLDGRETLTRLRQLDHFQKIPVILFTTSSQPSDKHFAEKHNAGFITKPIDFTQLETIINTFIDHCTDDIKDILRTKNNGR